VFIRRLALLILCVAALSGCRGGTAAPGIEGEAADASVREFLLAGLPARPWSLAGPATFDVEQYRVRGRFRLDVAANGDVQLEFSGSTLLGGHREDVMVALFGDTLRVFDRERARFYEGPDVERMFKEGTGAAGDWPAVLAAMVGDPVRLGLTGAVPGPNRLDATTRSGKIRLERDEGHLTLARWPDPVRESTYDDRLEVHYDWDGDVLSEIRLELPERGWRVRLERSSK